jgi:2-C-methyl-D-erythritol 4-phosphate cytidylyltransferase
VTSEALDQGASNANLSRTWVVVLAAGSGERLGGDEPKAFVQLAGRPLLLWTLATLGSSMGIDGLVVAAPSELLRRATAMVEDAACPFPVRVVPGGSHRQASVRGALDAVDAAAATIICHDAARPFASAELFERVRAALRPLGGGGSGQVHGAIPVIPSADTVKRVRDGTVVETISRAEVRLSQTPQAFTASVLRQVHAGATEATGEATDDASMLEAAGYAVAALDGDPANFKITTPDDLLRAEQFVRAHAGRQAAHG